MALLNFPDNPLNGQLYPDPCPVGVTQYQWDSSSGIWRIVGVATGVTPGLYGNQLTVGQFNVDVAGKITQANNVPIADASTTIRGVVRLNDTTTSISVSQALTARAGKSLQDQIGNLANCIVPNSQNVVAALNDLQTQARALQTDAMIWCGYYNAQEGDITYVSITGQRLGYEVGQELPTPGISNGGDFFVVTTGGNPYIAGDYNAPDAYIEPGNWIISEVARWSEVKARGGDLKASQVTLDNPLPPLTATNVQNALYQVTQLLRTPIGGATISDTKPDNPYPGQLWWDDNDGIFYIYYIDTNSSQWVELGGGGSQGLGGGGGTGTVYEIRTGVGLLGGPITTEGEISLQAAVVNSSNFKLSTIGGVIPNQGFVYSNSSGVLDLKISGDAAGKDPYTAFSQEGANLLNAKIDALSGGNVLAGTYDARNGVLAYSTPAGAAKGFTAGSNLPAPSASINNYYVIVTIGGGRGPSGDQVSAAGDWYICQADQVPAIWFLIDYEGVGSQAVNVSVTPIPGIEQGGNVQTALELIELQAQDRIEFADATTDGLQLSVSPPGLTSYDGTTLSIGLDYASVDDRGIVQLTNDLRGTSETLAITQFAANTLNAKVEALVGANVLAGTYNSNTGQVSSITAAGRASGFVVGQQAPAADNVPDNYYLIVIVAGGFGPPGAVIPPAGVQSGDWFIAENQSGVTPQWVTIDYENRVVDATQVNLSPVPGLSASNVQSGIEQLQAEIVQTVTQVTSANNGITATTLPVLADFGFKVGLKLNPATPTDIGGVFVASNSGLNLTPSGGLSLAVPTATTIGGVKAGDNITIAADGTISSSGGGGSGGELKIIDNISSQFDGVRTQFVLKVASANLPTNTQLSSLLISVGGVNQTPNTGFTWTPATSTITFTGPPAAGLAFDGRAVVDVVNADGAGGITSLTFEAPLTGGTITDAGTVGITDASATARGTMSPAQFTKLAAVGTNGNGVRTVSTSQPTGGSDGDIWYVV
jgi:hypothetical protein